MLLTNLFGPEDNFNLQSSHVVASLIKKFHDAKINNKKEAVVWGDGESTRDFCYVEDIAEGIVLATEKKLSQYGTIIIIADQNIASRFTTT